MFFNENNADAAIHPQKLSRRGWFRSLIGLGATTVAAGTYGREIEPFWLQWHDVPMPMRHLPPSFRGFRLVQLTDFHAGPEVPIEYLGNTIKKVNAMRPDAVVITGDLVSHSLDWVDAICDRIGTLNCPVFVTFGNHDYDVKDLQQPGANAARVPQRVADALETKLRQFKQITVLRNASATIEHLDGVLWIVGMEDLWSGRFAPQLAFNGVNCREPVIALSHNPDTAMEVDTYCPQWILAGHTHGGQIRIPGAGAVLLNIQNQQFDRGQFKLTNSTLYVSRGVGYLRQMRFCCRPEVPCFVLTPA